MKMTVSSNTEDRPAAEVLKHLSATGRKTAMRYLCRRGWISIKNGRSITTAKVVSASWDHKNNRVILQTNLKAKNSDQSLVIDIYIIEEIARLYALSKGVVLENSYPNDLSHTPVMISFIPSPKLH